MNKIKRFLVFSVIAVTAFACSNEPDYDAMANELCKCMRPLADMQKKVDALSNEGKMDEINEMIPTIEKLSEEGEACVAELEAKFGVVEGKEKEEKAEAAFKKACPDIAEMTGE